MAKGWLGSAVVKAACGGGKWKAHHRNYMGCAKATRKGKHSGGSRARKSGGKGGCSGVFNKGFKAGEDAALEVLTLPSAQERAVRAAAEKARRDAQFFNPEAMPLSGYKRRRRKLRGYSRRAGKGRKHSRRSVRR